MTTEWTDDSSLDSYPSLGSEDMLCAEVLRDMPPPLTTPDNELLKQAVIQLQADVLELSAGMNAIQCRAYAEEKTFPHQQRKKLSVRQSITLETLMQHIQFGAKPKTEEEIQEYREMLIKIALS